MLPIDFEQKNRTLTGPEGTDVLDLATFTDGAVCISCWELNQEERDCLQQSRAIWVHLWWPGAIPMHLTPLCPIDEDGRVTVSPALYAADQVSRERIVTKWALADEEVAYIQRRGIIWFVIESGHTQPPVGFSVLNPLQRSQN